MNDFFWAAFGGGAAAGLLVLVNEWFRWFLDRPLIKVDLSLGYLLPSGVTDNMRQVFYEARNIHTKPISISSFGLSYKRKALGKLQLNPQMGYQFPYKLEGQSSLSQWSAVDNLMGTLYSSKRIPDDLKWVWFKSSAGKLYRSKIKKWVLADLKREFENAKEALENYYGPLDRK